jgi:hypothetical protein
LAHNQNEQGINTLSHFPDPAQCVLASQAYFLDAKTVQRDAFAAQHWESPTARRRGFLSAEVTYYCFL